jgi:hypothetical protein
MKNYTINNGQFTAQGNFSGYTAMGDRVHFHKRQMDAVGFATPADVKFPFWAIAKDTTFGALDADGNAVLNADGTAVVNSRLTACSVFKTNAELTQAHVDEALVDVVIQVAIAKAASAAGLSAEQIAVLANASF